MYLCVDGPDRSGTQPYSSFSSRQRENAGPILILVQPFNFSLSLFLFLLSSDKTFGVLVLLSASVMTTTDRGKKINKKNARWALTSEFEEVMYAVKQSNFVVLLVVGFLPAPRSYKVPVKAKQTPSGYRPYSDQRHDRYESEAVRDRLTVFSMGSAVKSCIKLLDHL